MSALRDEIRAIVREEIREALIIVSKAADNYPGYDTDTIEDVAATVVQRVSEQAAETVSHEAGCPVRDHWYAECGCREARA